MKKTGIAALLCAMLIAAGGCGNSPPSDFYILTPMAGAGDQPAASASGGPLSLGVGPVKIPEYLNRAQIVSRFGQNRLSVNEFNRWGGSLGTNLARVVAQNLSLLLHTDDVFVFPTDESAEPSYRVVLSIEQFDGSLGDDVILDARWVITGPRRRAQLHAGRSVVKEATGAGGYEAYVAAQSRALEALSREIAARISALAKAGS